MKPSVQRRTVDPTVEPVTLTEAKTQLRVTHAEDDVYITTLITAAREWAEEWTKRAFIAQTWTVQYPGWPALDDCFELTRPNLISVTSVKYRDADDVEQTVSVADYQVETLAFPGEVRMMSTYSFPALQEDRLYPITIVYTAGYGASAANVPTRVKQAILMFVHHLYDNRVPVSSGVIATKVPLSVESLLGSIKRRNM